MGMTSMLAQSQQLIDTFNAKKAEIDAAVNTAKSTIIQIKKDFWVDSELGLDNNSGAENAPFQTIAKACNMVPIGGAADIRLVPRTTKYEINSDIILYNKVINLLGGSNPNTETTNLVTIKNNGFEYTNTIDNTIKTNATYGFLLQNMSFIRVTRCIIETADFVNPVLDLDARQGLIRWGSDSVNAIFIECKLVLGDTDLVSTHTITQDAALHFHSSFVSQVGPNRPAMLLTMYGGSPARVGFSSNVLPAGKTYKDLVSGVQKNTAGVPYNIISNFYFGD